MKITQRTIIINLSIILSSLILIRCSSKIPTADLILLNGNIITVDKTNSKVEAIAIKSDTIMAVGTNANIKKLVGDSTSVIDLKGKTAIPGFIESHAHLIGTGKSLMNVNLKGARNWDEVIYLVASAASNARRGEWIIGRGWHQEKWDPVPENNVNGYPIHTKLSNATPNNPVMLSHASGHAVFANAKAMEIANITSGTKDPRGGKIIRDSKGNPIGVFMEEAEKLISDAYKSYAQSKSLEKQIADKKKAIQLAMKECLSNGITSFHDAGASFEDLKLLKEMADNNELNIRLYEMIGEDYKTIKDSLENYKTIGYGDNHLTIRAIKVYMDGALGSRGAWLLSPYKDSPNESGLNVTPIYNIRKLANLAIEKDFQLCTHAIGDKANRTTLNLYEEVFNKYSKDNLRWRIEHAQHLSEKDIPRFAELGVIAAMQSIHCTSDAPFVEKRLGKYRAQNGSYAWVSLLKNNTIICNGTDSPVESLSTMENFYAAVTRKLSNGVTFYPEEKMNRMDALKSYTINGAYAAFEEDIKGSLETGKLADIVVLSKDILTIPESEILNTKIIYTIVGGKLLYEK